MEAFFLTPEWCSNSLPDSFKEENLRLLQRKVRPTTRVCGSFLNRNLHGDLLNAAIRLEF